MLKKKIVALLLLFFSANLAFSQVRVGADNFDGYLPLLKGKKVGVVVNHTSLLSSGEHLVDFLVSRGVKISYIMPPEHGFRGKEDAGATVNSGIDSKTSIKIVSLYGSNKEPKASIMKDIDILLYDLQDVGVRFYTYISTMHYCMEAVSKSGKKMIILDRPNPNGSYVDGPLRDDDHKSFVGIYPIPVVYGMTPSELALMAQGEGWSRKCDLKVVKCSNYTHSTPYNLPVNPSPNLKDMDAIYLYPSTCFFEGTILSVGRGTDRPFKIFGHPKMKNCTYSFTPKSMVGALDPPHKGLLCFGRDLSQLSPKSVQQKGVDFSYVIEAYRNLGGGESFFNNMFDLLTGVSYVKRMIISGAELSKIEAMWRYDIVKFKEKRKKYLIYE